MSAGVEVPAAEPAKSGWARLAGVLFAPVETFRDIARKPDIIIPLVAIVLVSAVIAIVMAPRVDFESAMREQMAQSNPNLAKDDLDRMVRFSTALSKAFVYVSPIINVIIFAIVAGILLLAFRLFGGEGTFKQAFSVTMYSWLPMIIGGVAAIIVMLVRGTVSAEDLSTLVMSNPGFLVDMKENPVAFAFLSSIDVFTIWTLVLFIIGFSFLSRMPRGRSAAIVLTLWGLMVLTKVGFAAVFAGRAAGA
ncbi:MAG TPA: Yip1 family protein [Thermoanaerobaculia bacterium]|nr:Yip1 family protein [Thermoanaerobaculia bacterium]